MHVVTFSQLFALFTCFVMSQNFKCNLPSLKIAVKDITFFKNCVRLIKAVEWNFEDDANINYRSNPF